MEKIKQALEKARREREGGTSQPDDTGVDHYDPDSTSIRYTKTKTVSGSALQMQESRLINTMKKSQYTDAVKILSTQVLQRMDEHDWTSILVTGPRDNTGSTTVAINLGLSIAKEVEYTVLVVDANLNKPEAHAYFGLEPAKGLSDYLTSDIELSDLLVNPEGIDHFVLLPGGAASDQSSELLASPRMQSLVKELTTRYPKRIIIFDVPSVLDTADTLSLLPCVDAALLVVEDDETSRSDLASAVDMLSSVNVIGTVLNKSEYI